MKEDFLRPDSQNATYTFKDIAANQYGASGQVASAYIAGSWAVQSV